MERINWKAIVIDLMALWFFMFSFQTLAFLSDVNLSERMRHSLIPREEFYEVSEYAVSLSNLNISLAMFRIIGLLTGFMLSIYISNRCKISWINSLLSFLIVASLGLSNLLGWKHLKEIFLLPGEMFDGALYYLTNASIMLALGVGLLLIKRSLAVFKDSNSEGQLHHA